jgi:lipoprotein-anchoring transpeptidase ErfK/SrfK
MKNRSHIWYVLAVIGALIAQSDSQILAQPRGSIVQQSYSHVSTSSLDDIPSHLRRQIVTYRTREAPGTIIIDTPNTYLYSVVGDGRAIRYGIGVGREGFTWSGTRTIERKMEWPDWTPPAEMIARQPYLPRFMAGGAGNPLGARAMYLSGTLYRIHGTSEPASIGKHVSSGCIRMLNEDAIDLYQRTPVGTKVVVLPDMHHRPVRSRPELPSPRDDSVTAQSDDLPVGADVPFYGPSRSFNIFRPQRY